MVEVETWELEGPPADEVTVKMVEMITAGMEVRPVVVILPPGAMDYVGGERNAGRTANEV